MNWTNWEEVKKRYGGKDHINDLRSYFGFHKVDSNGKVIKDVKSWPAGFADLKLKDGVYQE